MFIRSLYNYDRREASDAVALVCPEDDDLAKQEFREECDINTILTRFNVTGQMPHGVRLPSYGDFTQVNDFQQALAAIEAARDSFMEMPASVRRRFDNDPGAFVDFFADPANLAEARSLGLVPAAELELGQAVPGAAGSSASPAMPVAVPASVASLSTLPT